MAILEEIRSCEFDKNEKHLFGIKSAIMWGHSKSSNGMYPLFYIRKPKCITQEDFNDILDHLDFTIYLNKKVR
jgi:hypothetical protein